MAHHSHGPNEILPDPAPLAAFFIPNFMGILFAAVIEYVGLEEKTASLLPTSSHPFALLGLSLFVLANTASYLAGRVVCARIEYNVKLPNLYANKTENKNAVMFNCIQRGHQNFLENLPQYVGNKGLLLVFMLSLTSATDTFSFSRSSTGHICILHLSDCRASQCGCPHANSYLCGALLLRFRIYQGCEVSHTSNIVGSNVCECWHWLFCLDGSQFPRKRPSCASVLEGTVGLGISF